jgi:hypothetical protein
VEQIRGVASGDLKDKEIPWECKENQRKCRAVCRREDSGSELGKDGYTSQMEGRVGDSQIESVIYS